MPYGTGAETMEPEEQDMAPAGENNGRVGEIGRDLARLAKNIQDASIRAQLETYSEELGELAGETEEAEEMPAEEEGGQMPAPKKPAGKSAADRLAVAQLRKAVKI